MMRLIRLALLCLLLTTLFAWQPSPAFACEVDDEIFAQATHTRRTEAADTVLEGTIINTSNGDFPSRATVEVDVYYKGRGPAEITIVGFGGLGDCRSEVAEGDHLIFYATGDPSDTFPLNAYYLTVYDAVIPPSPDVIAEIQAAAGREPVEPDEPRIPLRSLLVPAVLGLSCLGVTFLGGLAAVLWRKRSQG